MKSLVLIVIAFWSSLLLADLVGDLQLSDPKNQNKLQIRHQNISTIQEVNTLFKEIDKLEQFGQLELILNDSGQAVWVTRQTKTIRDIVIKTGLHDKIPIDKLKNKFIGNPDSQYSRRAIVAELLDYLATVGYPQAQSQLKLEETDLFTDYDLTVWLGTPCIVSKIDSTMPFPPDVEFKIRPGDVCNIEHIHEEIENFEKNLLAEGYQNSVIEIRNVRYSPKYTTLHLTLSGAIGKRVNYEFIDESRLFITNAIDEETLLYLKKNFSDPRQAKIQALEYFKNRGFEFVQIRGPFKQIDDEGIVTYLFYVNPGDKYQITDLLVDGSHVVSAAEIKDAVLNNNLYELFSFSDSKTFEQAKNDIVNFYQSKGFWEAKVLRSYLEFLPKTKLAIMHATVSEGLQHRLSKVTVRGVQGLQLSDILSLLPAQVGDPIRQEDIAQLEYKIREKYFDKGYIESRTEISIKSEAGDEGQIATELIVDINEGPLVHIGTISIKGLIKTTPNVVLREFLFKQGDVYNQNLINQTRTALLNLGIFGAVTFERSDWISNEGREVDLTVLLREGDAGRMKFGPGYNLVRGLQYASEVSYNNLGGTGRRITLRGAISEERQQKSIMGQPYSVEKMGRTLFGRKISLGYTEPYIFNLPWNGNANVYHQAVADDIWKISNSLELSLSHNFAPDFLGASTITPFYRYQLQRDEGTPEQADSLTTTGFSRIGSVGVRYRLDKRDNLSFPTGGFLLNTEVSWARYEVFSEYRYFKWHVSDSIYKGLFKNIAIALGFSLTAYENVRRKNSDSESVDVLPANQRLLAGGNNDIRGYEKQLGPYVRVQKFDGARNPLSDKPEDPLGGTNLFILKAELRKQISPELFAVSIFWDAGNSFFTADELSKFKERFDATNTPTEIRSIEDNFNYNFADLLTRPDYLFIKNYQAAGFSLSLLTPLGALNASVGWPIREPQSLNCKIYNVCNERAKDRDYWVQKFLLNFNIGAEF